MTESQSATTSGLLSSIDQRLKQQGMEPAKFEVPATTPANQPAAPKKEPPKKVEIEPKLVLEKGPLFLNPAEAQSITGAAAAPVDQQKTPESAEKQPATRDLSKALVKGPTQPQATPAAKPQEEKKPVPGQDPENKGVFDQLRQDMDSVGKILNPFRW